MTQQSGLHEVGITFLIELFASGRISLDITLVINSRKFSNFIDEDVGSTIDCGQGRIGRNRLEGKTARLALF